MTFAIHGLAVARGIAIGRAVLVASSRVDVAHYFIEADQVEREIARLASARDAVVEEINRLLQGIIYGGVGFVLGLLAMQLFMRIRVF